MMKKELITKIISIVGIVIGLLLCLSAYLGVSYLNMVNEYETEIERLTNENLELTNNIEDMLEVNNELSNEIDELSENIYNLFEEQPYELSIEHDNEYITYQQDKFGWFDSYSKSVIYVKSSLK